MNIDSYKGLTFDDVLLAPQYCDIHSRQDVSLKARFVKGIDIGIPLVSSNMDTITEHLMMRTMHNLGGVGILHRFMNAKCLANELDSFNKLTKDAKPLCASIGINGDIDVQEFLNIFYDYGVNVACIDVAHGHCDRVIQQVKRIKRHFSIKVIAGNVATPEATHDLCEAGVDAVKVGIGPGSMCTTRLVTGCGVPQLTAINDCAAIASHYNVPIIADGGIRNSGDIVKALAAGADTVMIGSLFAGTDETPGDVVDVFRSNGERKKMKPYRGMASTDSMVGWKGRGYHAAPEGESKFVECRGSVNDIVKNLLGGICSGMTYCNARSILELQEKACFVKVSPNCVIENKPHGL
jgi:IMP dehydrogenase